MVGGDLHNKGETMGITFGQLMAGIVFSMVAIIIANMLNGG